MNAKDDPSIEQAVENMVEAARALPGAYSAEISLSYFAGVTNDKRWICEIDADIHGDRFGIWATTPQEAIELAIREAWRRVPNGDADVELAPEWYWRDAWMLCSVLLASAGSETDLADVLGATRRSSTPSVFMDRREFGLAVSKLVGSGLLGVSGHAFLPNARATALWQVATGKRPSLSGSGFTRSLLREMQSAEPAAESDASSWSLSETDYLVAIRAHIDRALGIAK
jgi:hypothetical protein